MIRINKFYVYLNVYISLFKKLEKNNLKYKKNILIPGNNIRLIFDKETKTKRNSWVKYTTKIIYDLKYNNRVCKKNLTTKCW